jgi:hypothetical protein
METHFRNETEAIHLPYKSKLEQWESYDDQREAKFAELQHRYDELIKKHSVDLHNAEERIRKEMNMIMEQRVSALTNENHNLTEEISRIRSSYEARIQSVRNDYENQISQLANDILNLKHQLSERSMSNLKELEKRDAETTLKYTSLIRSLEEDMNATRIQLNNYTSHFGDIKKHISEKHDTKTVINVSPYKAPVSTHDDNMWLSTYKASTTPTNVNSISIGGNKDISKSVADFKPSSYKIDSTYKPSSSPKYDANKSSTFTKTNSYTKPETHIDSTKFLPSNTTTQFTKPAAHNDTIITKPSATTAKTTVTTTDTKKPAANAKDASLFSKATNLVKTTGTKPDTTAPKKK